MSEPVFEINRIYIKDLSLETPNTPEIFKDDWDPEINLKLDNDLQVLEEDLYEVSLTLTVTATNQEKTAYVVEVEKAGIFTLQHFEEQQKGYIVGAMIPNILFPYARETISSLIQKAGFPPILLNPINFDAIYQQQVEEQKAGQAEKPANGQAE
ncbi:MAG: protein-export chaperone SecB [Gammaproteobacteria bacterium]|nr:MAG: protein-export chaperone SecB [Gammaproteobacteria bacterium]